MSTSIASNTNKKYIYNPAQANYYMEQGCFCIGTGRHSTTNKIFWLFRWEDTKEAYEKWVCRK